MKVLVCKTCKNILQISKDGKTECIHCFHFPESDSGLPEEIDVDLNEVSCGICKRRAIDTEWRETLPSYNAKSNTFYCGCRGWE